uniref:WD40 repeat n=1 Tax=Candidatus Kentrum sp. DK TaxID=2126562 RepID=A0A450SXW8_9GAMM|nr:MAG: WD40 repeat [Candidatus Kentron sp. DK]
MPESTQFSQEGFFELLAGVAEHLANPSAETIVVGIIFAVISTLCATLIVWLGRKIWRALSAFFRALATWLGAAPGFSYFVIRGYLWRVQQDLGTIKNIYIGLGENKERLDLKSIFVPLTPLLIDKNQRSQNQDDAPAIHTPRSFHDILTENPRLVILGDPGSGKTTLLKALASGISQRQWKEWRNLVPVFVPLRLFSRASDGPSLHHWLANTLLSENYKLPRAESLLKKLLRKGRLLLLLDGLDEVNSAELKSVLMRISDFIQEHAEWPESSKASPLKQTKPRCRIFLTCREQNYGHMSDDELSHTKSMTKCRLAEMRDSEVDAMVRSRQEDFNRHGKDISKFLDAIRSNSQIFHLHRTPLLLTLSIGLYLYRSDNAVPQGKMAFYNESIQHLLRRHDFPGDTQLVKANQFTLEDKYELLCQFALESMEKASASNKDFEDFPLDDLIGLAEAIARYKLSIKPIEARELVMEIRDRGGLIADTGQEIYVFAHRSFHEYCAARELVNLADEGFQRLQDHLTDPVWRETVFFFCGMSNLYARRITELLLDDEHDINRLELAGRCASVLSQPQIKLRLRVVTILHNAVSDATDYKERRKLLLSLLELVRDAPEEVYEAGDNVLRKLIIQGNPEELAIELSRLGKEAALPLLQFMVDSEEPALQQAALGSVLELEGLERVDLLWPLLAAFQTKGDEKRAQNARRALLGIMEKEGAVARLNEQQIYFDELTEEQLRAVYPFPTGTNQLVNGNFARLLTLEVDAVKHGSSPPHLEKPSTSWEKFLAMVVSIKEPDEAKDWQDLPIDHARRIWSIPSPWRLLGQIGVVSALLVGLWATVLLFMNGFDGLDDALVVTALLIGFTALGMVLAWPLWRSITKRGGWLRDYGILSGSVGNLLEGVAWRSPSTGLSRAIMRSFGRTLLRAFLFAPLVLCWALALWITNYGPMEHEDSATTTGITLPPDTSPLLTSSDRIVRLWDVDTKRELHHFEHSSKVRGVAFSPDGKRFLAYSSDNVAKLWNADTGQAIRSFSYSSSMRNIAFSPDGKRLLVGSGNVASLQDIDTGQTIYTLDGHSRNINCVSFSLDGQTIITGSDDKTARLWNANTGKKLRSSFHSLAVIEVHFLPSARRFLTKTKDNTVRIWDIDEDKNRSKQHIKDVTYVTFSPDGRTIIAGLKDHSTHLRDANTRQELSLHEYLTDLDSISFSADGRTLITEFRDGNIQLWDTDTGKEIQYSEYPLNVSSATFSPDNQTILTVSNGSSTDTWGTNTTVSPQTSSIPFWDPSTRNKYDILVFVLLIFLFVLFPTTKFFDPDRRLYIPKRPNRYIHLYDILEVERWLPK